MPRRRRESIGFLMVWMTVWTAAMLVAVWQMGAAALAGEPVAAVVLLVWLAAAGFALVASARRLKARLLGEKRPRPNPRHRWSDGFDPQAPPPPPRDGR
jgi:hypothetical protein